MSYRDPKFVYHGHASHADPTRFARRQAARRRAIESATREQAEAEAVAERERVAKVRPIVRKRAAG